jgi:TolB-like protein/Tfp pilus assembly protein PilF
MSSAENKAVFLSYASQDAAAVQCICDALRAAGVEVWFDQNELVGGDAWDAKIRKQIAECALFVPIVSAATQARTEGYFRLEWKLAAQRTHMIADDAAFLLPVVIDETRDGEARVPAEFKAVQWTRLRPVGDGGQARDEALEKFCERVKKLLGGEGVAGVADPGSNPASTRPATTKPVDRRVRVAPWAFGVLVALAVAVAWLWRDKGGAKESSEKVAAHGPVLSEAQKLERQARALIDVEPLAVRETYRTAVQLCEKAAALSPGEAEVWATMARANVMLIGLYQEVGTERVAAARSQAEKALNLAPDSVEAAIAMAAVELELLGVDPLAVRTRLEALLKRAPNDYRILLLLAQTEDGDTVSENATRWLAQAEAIPAGKAAAALAQAWVFWGANRLNESLEAVERSLAAKPMSDAYDLKLMLLKITNETEPAQAWLKQIPSVVLREDRAAAIAFETLYFAHKPEEALRVLQSLPREVLEQGRFVEVRALLSAEALLMADKKNAAEVELRAALKVIDERLATNPRHSRLWHAKGRTQIHLGDRAGAERSFSTAAELGGLRETDLAIQLMLLGRTDDTLAQIEKALDRKRTRWPSWLHYFKLHPVFEPLRSNPRYQQLITRADAWLAEDLRRAPAATPPKPDEKSVAVLAFKNVGGDPANEALVEGIGLELISVLGRVPGLTVRGNSSLSYFKGSDATAQEKGRKLNATYLVDGSVQRGANDTVRITANLTHAATNEIVWPLPPMSRDVKNIFAVQEEIAGLIAQALSLKLNAGSAASTAAVKPEAFELYVQARQAWNLRSMAGFDRAEELLNRALRLEPGFARAHAALADVWVIRGQDTGEVGKFGARKSPLQEKVIARVRQALDLDPNSAEAHASLGAALWIGWEFSAGERALRRALELNPNYASAHQWLGRVLLIQGRIDEANAALAAAARLDPLSSRILDNRGLVLACAGRFTESLASYEQALAVQPGAVQASWQKARVLRLLGREAEAREFFRGISGHDWPELFTHVHALASVGFRAEAADLLPGLSPDVSRAFLLPYVGRTEDALNTLNPDVERSMHIDQWLFAAAFDPMRSDPRFAKFLAALGLTEAHARAQAWRAAHPPEKVEAKK